MTQPPDREADRSTRQRLGEGLRAAGRAGVDTVVKPGGLSDQAQHWIRDWFRRVWELRGGGLYAVGFAICFAYLEITELFLEDIPAFLALDSYAADALLGFMIDFLIDTLMNTLAAFMWPVFVVQWYPPFGAVALGVAFLLFPKYLKPHIERWLFRGDEAAPANLDDGRE
jgi:hypothetical protein